MGQKIILFESLREGRLIKRYKRFLAEIELDDGKIITAHCANTGPMKGLFQKGSKVRVSFSPSPKRKLAWTWEQVEVVNNLNQRIWVGVNTLLANKIIKSTIEKKLLQKKIGEFDSIKSEVIYGKERKSKIDFLLTPKSSNPDNREIFIEVKNTTWSRENIALFPDTITTRGQKHLNELMNIIPASKGVLIPCITRIDVDYFDTGDEADPLYGKLFRDSVSKGLVVIPCRFGFHKEYITWEGFIPVKS